MIPRSATEAQALLTRLGASERLITHVKLVGEAADLLLTKLVSLRVPLSCDLVRMGVVLHDAGKILHPAELSHAGSDHEPAGSALLLEHGVSPEIARVCLSHARWGSMDATLEELVIALADKLWKGVRNEALEQRVIDGVASAIGKSRWDVFVELDTLFEEVAAGGAERLERSRC